jgi:hypothetical protein
LLQHTDNIVEQKVIKKIIIFNEYIIKVNYHKEITLDFSMAVMIFENPNIFPNTEKNYSNPLPSEVKH